MERHEGSNRLLAIEGLPFTGKTTLTASLARKASMKGRSVATFKEFSETDVGRFVEASVNNNSYRAWPAATQTFLFLADKCSTSALVQEALSIRAPDSSVKVILDRSIFSVLAFQLAIDSGSNPNHEQNRTFLEACNTIASTLVIVPQLVICLDMAPALCYERGLPSDAFYSEELQRIREAYLLLADQYNFQLLDASGTIETVTSKAIEFLEQIQWL